MTSELLTLLPLAALLLLILLIFYTFWLCLNVWLARQMAAWNRHKVIRRGNALQFTHQGNTELGTSGGVGILWALALCLFVFGLLAMSIGKAGIVP